MSFEDDLRRVDEHVAEARRLVQRQKELDQLEQTFLRKAIAESDPACAQLVVKIKERRAVLLRLSAPTGHAITIISQPGLARDRESSLAAYRRAFAAIGKPLPPRADADTGDAAH